MNIDYQPVGKLSGAEQQELNRLDAERRDLDAKLWAARKVVSDALRQRNAIARQLKRTSAKWLPLMEKKYGK